MGQLIKAENITKTYETGDIKVTALNNVNVDINKGELTILKGRSGSGKTTLINVLSTLERPDNGVVFLCGKAVNDMTEKEKDLWRKSQVGFVFQSGALLYNMTAFENIEFALRIAGYNRADIKERAEDVLKMVGLYKRLDHFPFEMSGGEIQRIAIGRAICHKPSIIFADEPTSALDTKNGLTVIKIFKELIENEGFTIIMTTHDPNLMELGDKVYALKDGVVVDE